MFANAHHCFVFEQDTVLVETFNLSLLLLLYLFSLELAELRDFKPRLLFKIESHRVDLISQTERRRTVIENIAKM